MYDLSAFLILGSLGFGRFPGNCLVKYSKTSPPVEEKLMACKIIPIPRFSDITKRKYLKREVKIIEELQDCVFFPKLYMVSDIFQKKCLFMEFCEGGELSKTLKIKAFDTENIRFYAAEILMALKYMHEKGIIYRDLKLDNIWLARTGHVKIIDFGFSAHKIDIMGEQFGTLEYMSPEVFQKQFYSEDADFWSFGVLLYFMYSRSFPFINSCGVLKGQTTADVYIKELVFLTDVDSELKDLISKLLVKDFANRLTCIEEIMKHGFFKTIDWDDVIKLKLVPPFIPAIYQEKQRKGSENHIEKLIDFLGGK